MILTHTNSVYSEDIVLYDHVPYPQYVHEVSDGGIRVGKGIRTMPEELVNYVLDGKYNAASGTREFLEGLAANPNKRVGLILAGGNTAWLGYDKNMEHSPRYPTHRVITLGTLQVYAGYLSYELGGMDYISSDSTSCISGHSAWYTASLLLRSGELDTVIVVATDNGISEENLSIFGGYNLVKLRDEEGDPSIVKFRLGQGCNISVFEREDASENYQFSRIRDIHIGSELCQNPMGMSKDGKGYRDAIQAVDTTGIDFVKTHSTFSTDNQIEEEIIRELFGDIPQVNYKLRIGHTMGPCTALETALAIQEESGVFLSLGAGMGNVFSSVVVEILS